MGSGSLILIEVLLVIFNTCNVEIVSTGCQEIVSIFSDNLVYKIGNLKNST